MNSTNVLKFEIEEYEVSDRQQTNQIKRCEKQMNKIKKKLTKLKATTVLLFISSTA